VKLEVIAVNEQENGDAELEIELDEEYIAHLKNTLHMKRWSNKKFQNFVIKAITDYLENNK
jgi:hypothetical protein